MVGRCPPPFALTKSLRLLRDATWLTEEQVAPFLRLAGLSELADPVPVVRGLARLWPVAGAGDLLGPTTAREMDLEQLARQVRSAGVISAPRELPAGDSIWLRERRRIAAPPGYLVAANDISSKLARPVRRQLAAAGGLSSDELLVGCRRESAALRRVDEAALTAWAWHQPDITVRGGELTVGLDGVRWLGRADQAVLALFASGGPVRRQMIFQALEHRGLFGPSAEQWVFHCGWLRGGGSRGRYVLAGSGGVAAPPS